MYQYTCSDCGQPFEKKLSMSQAGEQQECPTCGSSDTRKRLGAVAVGGQQRTAMTAAAPPPRRSPFS